MLETGREPLGRELVVDEGRDTRRGRRTRRRGERRLRAGTRAPGLGMQHAPEDRRGVVGEVAGGGVLERGIVLRQGAPAEQPKAKVTIAAATAKPSSVTKATSKNVPSETTVPEEAAPLTPKKEPTPPSLDNTDDSTTTAADSEAIAPTSDVTVDATIWPQILDSIRKKYSTLYSIIKTAEPHFTPGVVTLEFSLAFYQKRTNDSKNKQIIADAISTITGESIQIVCTLGEGKPKPIAPVDGEISHTVSSKSVSEPPVDSDADYYVQQAEKEAASRPISTISNIFGGGELLES